MAKSKKAAKAETKVESAVAPETATVKSETKSVAKHTVKQRFSGKDKKQYEVGDDVSHFDADRLAGLIERGLVK